VLETLATLECLSGFLASQFALLVAAFAILFGNDWGCAVI
jgi:hypothetical protein